MLRSALDPSAKIHVIGAGLAGLSAATMFAEQGHAVTVYEAAPHAGGRCRSFFDTTIERYIDNGNHLFLSGNTFTNNYLVRTGGAHLVSGPDRARFEFMDCQSQQDWCIDAGAGLLPWPLLLSSNRPPGVGVGDLMGIRQIFRAAPADTIEEVFRRATERVYRTLWEPLAIAVLNTPPNRAEALALASVLKQAFRHGARTCLPRMATKGLSDTFIEPALRYLSGKGADVRFNMRLGDLGIDDGQVYQLSFPGETLDLRPHDRVVLALPPWALADKIPGLSAPASFQGIINAHFLLPRKFDELTIIGLINGLSQWIFVRDDIASITISAVEAEDFEVNDRQIAQIWTEICCALKLGDVTMGKYRLIKEKRATVSHDQVNNARRPLARTRCSNLVLAGDWVQTGLPATIEGAIKSGQEAAKMVLTSVRL